MLILTYAASLEFFERFALGETRGLQAASTVIADAHMVSADPVSVRGAGLRYSAFVKRSEELQGPADIEFMWATTHPFLVTHYTELTATERIVTACASHAARLGSQEVDEGIAGQLAERLWLSIVNPRIDEMIPGLPVRAAVAAKLVEMHS